MLMQRVWKLTQKTYAEQKGFYFTQMVILHLSVCESYILFHPFKDQQPSIGHNLSDHRSW